MTEGSSPARVLYSDRDYARIPMRRMLLLAIAICSYAVFILGVIVIIAALLASGVQTAVLQTVLPRIAVELVLIVGASYVFVRYLWHDLRHGTTVTAEAVRFLIWTIPVASILRAEMVRFGGLPECLAISQRIKRLGRDRVRTVVIAREETESLEAMRDSVRVAAGLPPQAGITESTWQEWCLAAEARLRRPVPR